jgi:hypothetical protein
MRRRTKWIGLLVAGGLSLISGLVASAPPNLGGMIP